LDFVTSIKSEKYKQTKIKSLPVKTLQNLSQPPTFTISHHQSPQATIIT